MDPNPIRPMRGKARGRPQMPNMAANQQGPMPPRPQFTSQPRPIQIAPPTQPGMNRPPRPMPPRPSGMVQRAPYTRPPLGPRPTGDDRVKVSETPPVSNHF